MKKLVLALIAVIFVSGSAIAQDQNKDEIKSLIEGGWKSYVEKDYIGGAEKLEKASGLMRAARVKTLIPFLPSAPEGWVVQEEKDQSEGAGIGGAMLGGMSVLERKFTKGSETVSVKIITDSPLFTSIISMLKLMPAGTEVQQGYEKYKSYYAQFKAEEKANEFNIFEENGLAITIEGKGMAKETALLFADKIDFESLTSAIKK